MSTDMYRALNFDVFYAMRVHEFQKAAKIGRKIVTLIRSRDWTAQDARRATGIAIAPYVRMKIAEPLALLVYFIFYDVYARPT